MARKKKAEQPIGVGLTTKQMKRKKPLNTHYLTEVNPLTDHQTELFNSYSCLLYTSPSPRDQRGSGMPSCG